MSSRLDYSKLRRPGAAQDLKVVGNRTPGRYCWLQEAICVECGSTIRIGSRMKPGRNQPPAHYRCT